MMSVRKEYMISIRTDKKRTEDMIIGIEMKITLVRNATLLVEYCGNRFLVDPVFAKKGARDPFPCDEHPDDRNPLVDMPLSVKEILKRTDAVILTHLHSDHFDNEAAESLPKDIDMFVQDEQDRQTVEGYGFTRVEVLPLPGKYYGIELIKTPGRHGEEGMSKAALDDLGNVCGVILHKSGNKKLYIAGDTVWYEGVAETLAEHKPDVIVLNAGANRLSGDRLVMDEEDVLAVHKACPDAVLVAVHMEAFNHWTLSRRQLWEYAGEKGFRDKLLIPADGEGFSL